MGRGETVCEYARTVATAVSAGSIANGVNGPLLSPEVRGHRVAVPTWVAVGVLVTAAAVLRFYAIGRQGFWFDEANTAQLVRFSPGQMLGLIPKSESTPPLYYCVVWVWSRLFGDTEAGLRSFSALCGVLVVPVAYGIGRTLSTRRTALVLAALVAFSPLLIWYSQEARSYELVVLLTSVALLAMVRARADPSPPALAVWVIASALSLATHYYAVLAIVPQAVWLFAERRRRRDVQVAVGIVLLCGAALIPLALSQNSTGHDSWIAQSSLALRLSQIIPQVLVGTGAPDRELLKWLAYVAAADGLILLATRADPSDRRPVLLAGALAGAGLAMNFVLIAAGVDDLITRNLIALLVPVLILFSGGLGARRAGLAGLVATVVLCVIGITAALGVAADRSLQRPDWRPVARALGPRPAPGQPGRVILIQHYLTLLPLSLYLSHLKHLPPSGETADQLDVISIPRPSSRCAGGARPAT